MMPINSHQLFSEIEDLIRTMPPIETIRHNTDENSSWLGRALALIKMWDRVEYISFSAAVKNLQSSFTPNIDNGLSNVTRIINQNRHDNNYSDVARIINQAQHDLRLKSIGPLTKSISLGEVFDYFDEIRKKIETAKSDILFVDPYLNTEFVSRYLLHVPKDTKVRLLTTKQWKNDLMTAVPLIIQQQKLQIEVRVSPSLHDRFMFIDKQECYQSGTSFKDGAKNAHTTLTQITDAFLDMCAAYEKIWNSATVLINE